MRHLLAAALAACLSHSVAHAQPAPSAAVPLTLDEALRLGAAASHRVREAGARADAADAAADQRRAATRPLIGAQGGYTRTNHVDEFGVLLPNNQLRIIYPDIPDNYRARLDAQWLLYDGGRLRGLERAALAESAALGVEVDVAHADLRLEITRAYWDLVTAIETQRVVEEGLAQLGVHLTDVRNQLAAGIAAPNDVLSAEAQESRQRMLAIQARSDREVAQAALARLAGLPAGTEIAPASALDAPPPAERAVEPLVREAQDRSLERAALLERIRAAEERERAAAAGLKPTVALAGGVDYARPNPRIFPRQARWDDSWDASVNVNWPLFDGGRRRAEVAEAAASTMALRERLAELDTVLALDVRQRLGEIASARAAIAAAGDGVRAAAEARRVAGERFNAGVATSTDVLDAQIALLQARLDHTAAAAAARVAEARLARALGR